MKTLKPFKLPTISKETSEWKKMETLFALYIHNFLTKRRKRSDPSHEMVPLQTTTQDIKTGQDTLPV